MYLCRLCLNKSELCFSLFSGNILDKIESLTSIKITKSDKLPQTCCETCMANVYSSYNFQQTVIEANNRLRKLPLADLEILEDTNAIQENSIKQEIYVKQEEQVSSDECSYTEVHLDDSQDVKSNTSRASSSLEISDLVMLDYKNDECEGSTNYTTELTLENCEEIICKLSDSAIGKSTKILQEPRRNTEELECLDCCIKFSSKRLLQLHMAKHKVDRCPFCNIVMRRDNLKKHIQIHSDSPEICEVCGKIAKNKESLRGHINYSHKKKAKIKCNECEKEFKSAHHYNTHVRNVHLGIRNHQCDICGKKFFSNYDLKKHISMTHKKARPYQCSYCGKCFSSPYARKTHIRQHTLETPYHCDICTAGFRQKVSLLTHIKSKHTIDKVEKEEIESID